MITHTEITRYDAKSKRNRPLILLRGIASGFVRGHGLGYRFAMRNVKAQYRQSVLGILWAIIPPVATALVWILLKRNGVFTFGNVAMPYALFALSGTLLWQIFSEAINAPIKALTLNKAVITKMNIPPEALIVSGFYELLFNTLLKMAIFLFMFIAFSLRVDWGILMFLVLLLFLIFLGFALGLFLTPIGMLYGDVGRGLQVALPFLMLLSPVIYPIPSGGILYQFCRWNSISVILDSARAYYTSTSSVLIPLLKYHLPIIIILLLAGIMLYKIAIPILVERFGA